MSTNEIISKIEALREWESLIANAQEEAEADDTELVAVIAAAIAASEGAASTDGFVVRSIRKVR